MTNDDIESAERKKLPWMSLEFGFQRGTIIGWEDGHRDQRIRILVDTIAAKYPGELVFTSLHEGEVVMVWRNDPPAEYAEGSVEVAGDWWTIKYSGISL